MVKIYVISNNRASDGAISKLIRKMKKEGLYTNYYPEADYVLAVGDREETFDKVLLAYRDNKPIIHLWAGELSQGTHDEAYRHSITLMSKMQLCTNHDANEVVKDLCKSVNKRYVVAIVGNIMLDNLDIDESEVPDYEYDLVLYNPVTVDTKKYVERDILDIKNLLSSNYIWIEPNGDKYSDLIEPHCNQQNLPREKFLGLMKNCSRFITNSSCEFYEAPFVMKGKEIIHIGTRNLDRNSKYSDMVIRDASENVMKVLRSL